MKRLLQLSVALFLASGLAGCCFSPGYVDSTSGVMYGGGWQPCNLPDPFALFGCGCWGGGHGCWGGQGCGQAPGYCDPCGTSSGRGSWGHYPTSVSAGGPYINGIPEVVPSVPAGIYEEAVPHPSPMPVPEAAPANSTTPGAAPTVLYEQQPWELVPQQATSIEAVPVRRWVPARF